MTQAIQRHGVPDWECGPNEAAIKRYNEEHGTRIIIRQVKYLNNIVEQDHRARQAGHPSHAGVQVV